MTKTAGAKTSSKQHREKKVLLSLIDHYIETGKPIGSNTLKEADFDDISSATIRNYFSDLEKQGYLQQLHTSGGRVPTDEALRLYADEWLGERALFPEQEKRLKLLKQSETREIARYLQQAAEELSSLSGYAVFCSAPRFDHDVVIGLKVVPIDVHRFLCVVITDFGVIQTELLHSEEKLSAFALKRIESYFHFRLTGLDKPENLTEEEEELAKRCYNEVMLRYIVGYSSFSGEDVYKTGFSRLLAYPELQDAALLANTLSLFENAHSMRLILRECTSHDCLKYWIGKDLAPYADKQADCSVIAIPYRIHKQTVGAVGLLGPTRLPYKNLFALLRGFSESVSEALTRNIYKFKIDFRQPSSGTQYLEQQERLLIGQSRRMLLEDKSR